ncbi:MAG: hypothetical protein ACI8Y4_002176 [Candidatus Poriferisodalaceae bacterium]|jgi:hypothetical protein
MTTTTRRLALTRALVTGFAVIYLAIRAPHILDVAELPATRFRPIGVVGFLTESPVATWLIFLALALALVSGALATIGWQHRWSGPTFALLLLWLLSYRLSWGQVLHTENLMVLHVLVLGFGGPACAERLGRTIGTPRRVHPWPLHLMSAVTAATYLIAAWAKIRNGGVDWITGDTLRNQIAHDNLRKLLLGDVHSALGGWLTRYGWVFAPLAAASMLVELGAPLAIVWKRLTLWWIGLAWLFHIGVLALMAILFPYQLFAVAYASMLPLDEWSVHINSVISRRPRRRSPRAHLLPG